MHVKWKRLEITRDSQKP